MPAPIDYAELCEDGGTKIIIGPDTCRDFVYFRQIIRNARRSDDNIAHSLNKIDSSDAEACAILYERMKKKHQERADALEFCKGVLRKDIEDAKLVDSSKARLLQKEFGLLDSECVVEDIIYDRTETAIRNRCKNL